MNENRTPDKHLLDQIERVLEEGQTSDNALLDDLARSQPQARSAFRQSLEDQLLARMQPNREGEIHMTTAIIYADVRAPRRSLMPFTLVATLLAVVITLGLLMGGAGRQPSLVALAQLTPSPTPEPIATFAPTATPHVTQFNMTGLRPVVITRADIPRGTKIAGNVVMKLAIVLWPNEMVPEGAYIEMLPLAGMIVKNDIHQWQPILAEDVTDTNTIPSDKIAVSIPAASITSDLSDIHAGDYVDVIATYLYADVGTAPSEFQQVVPPSATSSVQAVTQRMVKAALVAAISELDGVEIITLAVSEQEAKIIPWLVDAKLPITLRDVESSIPAALPPYRLDVPLDAVNRMWAYPHEGDPDRGVRDEPQVGDRVNVAVGFIGGNTVGVQLDLEPLVDSQPSWFMVDPITGGNLSFTMYKPTNSSPQLGTIFVRQIVRNAEITTIKTITSSSSDRTYSVLTLEVPASSADLAELKAYIEAQLPYLVMRSD